MSFQKNGHNICYFKAITQLANQLTLQACGVYNKRLKTQTRVGVKILRLLLLSKSNILATENTC